MFKRTALLFALGGLLFTSSQASGQTVVWPPQAAAPFAVSGSGCPSTGTWPAGAVSEASGDSALCYASTGGSSPTWLECIDPDTVGLAVPVEHAGAGCPATGSYAEGTVALSTADATLCYCTASGSPGTWWTIVETVSAGPEVVATWSALPGSPEVGDQAFVQSSSLLVTWTDADPVDLWLPEPWASDVQGRVANGSAVELYISVAAGDDELTDLTGRGWTSEGSPTFDVDRFTFGEARVEATPASWPTVALYAVRADCTQVSGTQSVASFAPAVYDGTKTAIASRTWAATAAAGAEDQSGVISATTPGTTFYGVAQGGFAAVASGLTWTFAIVDQAGAVTVLHQDSPHRAVVPYSGLGAVLATTGEVWIGTGLTVGEVPTITVDEVHIFDLDAP